MRFRLRSGAAVLVAAAALLAGCAKPIPGSAVPNQADLAAAEEARKPLTADAALGDVTTINPCSYLSADTFTSLGTVSKQPQPSFDECTVTVTLSGVPVEVRAGTVTDRRTAAAIPMPSAKEGPRGLAMMADAANNSAASCSRYLGFVQGKGDVLVRVWASTDPAQPPSALGKTAVCKLAEAGVDSLMATVAAKKVQHWDLPANSFGKLDACQVVTSSDLAAQLGPLANQVVSVQQPSPAKHVCLWGRNGAAQPHVRVFLHVGDLSTDDGGQEETIAGRRTIVLASPADSQYAFCLLDTPGAQFGVAGSTEPEVASILVWLMRGTGDACGIARNLANTAWTRLPAA